MGSNRDIWKNQDRECPPCVHCGAVLYEAFWGNGGWVRTEKGTDKTHGDRDCVKVLRACNEVLKEALRFYADDGTHAPPARPEGDAVTADELRKLYEAGTRGPWYTASCIGSVWEGRYKILPAHEAEHPVGAVAVGAILDDAALIVAMHAAFPALLAVAEAATLRGTHCVRDKPHARDRCVGCGIDDALAVLTRSKP